MSAATRLADPVEVVLTKGLVALIDAEDAPRILAHKWRAKTRTGSKRIYAQRTERIGRGRSAPKLTIMMHHEVFGHEPGQIIDHINGNPLDNRKSNLRRATVRQNGQNQISANLRRGGFKGVYKPKKSPRWCAAIACGEMRPNGKRKRVHLGSHDTPELAAAAYDLAAVEHFGEFAALNFPDRRADYETELQFRAAVAEDGARAEAFQTGGAS